jgi:16S rRNA (guanine527-N7)-methyltransferase
MIDKQKLYDFSKNINVELSATMLDNFDEYAKILVEWNEKVNLTSITEPDEIIIKHFVDSLALLNCYQLEQNSTLIDVGTGAGFPSVPIKIARDDIIITLLDSLNKRLNFLKELCKQLDIEAKTLHARAEQAGTDLQYREKFDVATARAVASLNLLCELCLPFVKVGGVFIVLKGFEIEFELEQAKNAIKVMGGKLEKVIKYQLPDTSKRAIIIIRKISKTHKKYPRQTSKIKKMPL